MPWPFRRNSQASSPSESGRAPVAQREQRADWRTLPPLSETMAPPPLVAPNSRFSAGLAVNNAPPPSLGHMGHQRSLDATPGLALGLAKPVSRSVDTAAASAAVRPSGTGLRRFLQRRTATAAPAAQSWPDDPAPAQPGAPTVDGPVQPVNAAAATAQRSATTSRPSPTHRSAAAADGGSAPNLAASAMPKTTSPTAMADIAAAQPALPLARRVSPVPKDQAVTAATGLTTAPRELRAPTVQRSSAATSPSPMSTASPMTGIAAPFATPNVPFLPGARPATHAKTAAPIVSRDAALAPRLTLGQSRRAGLGAPVGKIGGADAAPTDSAAAAAAQPGSALPTVAQRQIGPSVQRQPSPAAPSAGTAQSPASSTAANPAPGAGSAGKPTPALGSGATVARSVGSIGAMAVKPVQRTRFGLGEPLDLAARPVSRQPTLSAADGPLAPASPEGGDSASGAAPADAPLVGGMATQTMAMPTVSRLADGDDDDAGGMAAGGAVAPLTLRHDRASAESIEEQTPAPTSAATAPISAGSDAGHGTPVLARPVSVARLVDASSTTGVGGLVGAQSLLHRSVQRSADGATGASRTPAPSSAGRPVGALANGPATGPTAGATPGNASSMGDFASAVSAAGSAESAPSSFALSSRRPSMAAASLPVAGRSVQRAVVQRLPAPELALAPTRAPSQASIEATAMAVAQRAIDARAEEAPPPAAPVQMQAPVQRAVTIDEVSTEAGSTASTAGASSATPHSPAELEQLATKLWGRLRLQLRRELLADRERAGMLTDLH